MALSLRYEKQKFMLEHIIKAQRGKQKYQLYSFFNLTTRWLWVVNDTP
jgi:hypothetical protein